jgi:NAD-specific glutamate dehydrogenase
VLGRAPAADPRILRQPAPIIITVGSSSTVHRRAMDYVGVKLFGRNDELTGELRIVGLFTSSAYTQNPNDIPVARRKLNRVVQASGFSPSGHSGKALIAAESFRATSFSRSTAKPWRPSPTDSAARRTPAHPSLCQA